MSLSEFNVSREELCLEVKSEMNVLVQSVSSSDSFPDKISRYSLVVFALANKTVLRVLHQESKISIINIMSLENYV